MPETYIQKNLQAQVSFTKINRPKVVVTMFRPWSRRNWRSCTEGCNLKIIGKIRMHDEVLDAEGWFRSGDLGLLDSDVFIYKR